MSRDPFVGHRLGRGEPRRSTTAGRRGGPTQPDGPEISRRTLLRVGAALSVALIGGGTADLVLQSLASPKNSPVAKGAAPPTTETTETTETPETTVATSPAPAPTPPATRVVSDLVAAPNTYFGPSTDRHVYVTIDDGYFPDNRVIDLIKSEHVPITTFLIAEAASEHLSYWKAFVAAGGQIQNHTYSHPDLTTLSQGGAESQWARANKSFASWFGRVPTLGRPPYGAFNNKVALAAREAGLDTMILWSALDDGDGIQTWNSGPIAPGSIILLHWTPGLYADLTQVLQTIDDKHLVPAFLTTT